MPKITSVPIRPGIKFLSILPNVNYKPWYAIAEFVDNAVQSYLSQKKRLLASDGRRYKLKVEIEITAEDGGRICIRDNAAGIHAKDYIRAFQAAEVPPDRNGLSEFGMGMKSAACWYARKWSVRTSALGENEERTVNFDIAKILEDNVEDLKPVTKSAKAGDHYTELVLTDLHRLPQGPTKARMKEHLAGIYRRFIQDGSLDLIFCEEKLQFQPPKILSAPYYKTPRGPNITWKKNIEIDLGHGRQISGFAAIREKGSTSHAGFAILRRGRLILGSGDETYRPEEVFGRANSFTYQRIFGELDLTGFAVTHTKDGIEWDGTEQAFLELLHSHLNDKTMPLLRQAEEYRSRPNSGELKPAAEAAGTKAVQAIQGASSVLGKQLGTKPSVSDPPKKLKGASQVVDSQTITIDAHNTTWSVTVEQINDPGRSDWLDISDKGTERIGKTRVRKLVVRISLAHPFMQRFAGTDREKIEPLIKIGCALALAETSARESGVKQAGVVRHNLNELLRDVFSQP